MYVSILCNIYCQLLAIVSNFNENFHADYYTDFERVLCIFLGKNAPYFLILSIYLKVPKYEIFDLDFFPELTPYEALIHRPN
jgi:hypothetical protein